jgi:ubiquinone/menaquinone biosynthesis C-methylase UbiE
MDFTGDIGRWQRKITECREGIARRQSVVEALQPAADDSILDIGCGAGHLVQALANCPNAPCRIVGIDVGSEQLAAARDQCSDLHSVEIRHSDATDMDFDTESFDKVASIQTLEYIDDVDRALAEIRRILKPGGRVVVVSVLWDHWRFHGPDPVLNGRIIEAFRAHCPHQMLPLQLPEKLAKVGFENLNRESLAFFNGRMEEQDYAGWAAKTAAAFAITQGVFEEDARDWLSQLGNAEKDGRFGFVSVPILTSATIRS